ncbi:hypothetical protein SCHPADRAFT_909572 [Schizopora paradoxa]|uniref:Uncharacterized protein n=1 Tax=Schizopora paradoxa TaxID=27342 RepID=A0A0H2R6B3_9AGAM|nr:hypothetical protein SCHPADRAFT_909572 [Schizopora paradoxa]
MLEEYSTRDRLEILRIIQIEKKRGAERASDDGAYKDMWKRYLKSKGRDIIINFSS